MKHIEAFELTPEIKARLLPLAHKIIDLITEDTDNPLEGFFVLAMLNDGLAKSLGLPIPRVEVINNPADEKERWDA